MKSSHDAMERGTVRLAVLVCIILFAAAARIAPHPWNFTPVGAMALFSGAMLRERRMAFGVPLAAMLLGDAVTGFHVLMPVVYGSFLLSVWIGRWLRPSRTIGRVTAATLAGAAQFFLITNFALWLVPGLGLYPKTLGGLLACYLAGIPFFWNTLAGDALYASLLFGGYAIAERRFAILREPELLGAV
jgi:Family of unknown function (DUF6580)